MLVFNLPFNYCNRTKDMWRIFDEVLVTTPNQPPRYQQYLLISLVQFLHCDLQSTFVSDTSSIRMPGLDQKTRALSCHWLFAFCSLEPLIPESTLIDQYLETCVLSFMPFPDVIAVTTLQEQLLGPHVRESQRASGHSEFLHRPIGRQTCPMAKYRRFIASLRAERD